MTVAARRTLVLNSDFRPLSTWPLSLLDARDAVSAIWRDRVTVVEDWPGEFFRSPSTQIAVPKTVALREYAKVHAAPKLCRRSILLRDGYRCQFCGEQFPSEELTYDHLVPRSRGGRTEWGNILAACIPCNAEQADRPAHLKRPLKQPRQPTSYELLEAGLRFLPNDVRDSWRDFLYWNAELDQ
jgi:5-methylcytosine-specific restriction endonuclease McrA